MKARLSKSRIGKRVDVEFWDHTQGAHKPALSQVPGWLLSYTPRDLVIRLWNYPEDPEYAEAVSDVTILRSTIKHLWFPKADHWTKPAPKR